MRTETVPVFSDHDSLTPREAPAEGVGKREATWTVVGLTLAAAVLRFVGLGHQSYWYDEAFTVVLLHHSLPDMLSLVPQTEGTPPLYYCLAWLWTRVFGYTETGVRSLSALASVATVPAMYGAGAKLVSRRAGVIAAALACCNPLFIWYAQEARSYALLVLLATLSLLAFAYVRGPHPSRWALCAWALAAGLTLATHYYGVLIVVPEALWLLWVHRRDPRVLAAVVAVGAVGLALLPMALGQTSNTSWIAHRPLGDRLRQLGPQLILGTGAPARTALKVAGAAAVLLAGVLLARRSDARERRGALVAGALALAGFMLSLGLILAGFDEFITRNLIVLLVALIVLVAGGLGAHRAGVLGALGAATLCTVGLIATIAVATDWKLQRPEWRRVAHVLAPHRPTGAARAILFEGYKGRLPLALYVPGLRFMSAQGARVDELDLLAVIRSHGNWWYCWWGSTCNLSPATLDATIHLRGFRRDGPVVRVHYFAIVRLRAARPRHLTPQAISRALTVGPKLTQDGLLIQPPA